MTPAEREAARARCEAATAGPWTLGETPDWDVEMADGRPLHDTWFAEDARFVAHARTDLPAALAELDRRDVEREQMAADLRALATFIMRTVPIPCATWPDEVRAAIVRIPEAP